MTSILESVYIEPVRPYSQKELQNKLNNLHRKLRIGKVGAKHKRCGHSYLTKMNGRKEKEIELHKNPDTGNCSVCWKLQKTSKQFHDAATDMVQEFTYYSECDNTVLEPYVIYLITAYYTWLYTEFM